MINPQQFCFLFTFLFYILYYITLIVIQVNDHNMVVHPFSSACQIFSYASHPNFALAAQKDESPFTFKIFKVTNENCNDYGIQGKWTIKYRPIVGDHIHLGISIRENNVDLPNSGFIRVFTPIVTILYMFTRGVHPENCGWKANR